MRYDVAIIGAGPAGCAAAITLARAGRSTIVFEKCRFPRPKTCGGCLSGRAVRLLHSILGENAILPGVESSRIYFSLHGKTIYCSTAGQTRIALRSELDAILANAAADCGAEVHFGTCASLGNHRGKIDVTVGGGTTDARNVLIATGLQGSVARLGFGAKDVRRTLIGQQWLASAKTVDIAPGVIEMHWLRGGYLGLAAPDKERCIVALAVDARKLNGMNPTEGLRTMNPHLPLWDRISDGHRNLLCGAAGFPFTPQRLTLGNAMLIGDAAGYAEPFSGTGIELALHSGIVAARTLLRAGNADEFSAAMGMHRRRGWQIRVLRSVLDSRMLEAAIRSPLPLFNHFISGLVRRIHVESATV